MKLLLTGATGFVGRNLLLKALADGRYEEIIVPVRSVDKLALQFKADGFDSIPERVSPIVAVAPKWELETRGVDHIVHSAGVLSANRPDDYFKMHVEGTLALLRRCSPASKIVILSSQAATGPTLPGEIKTESAEDSPVTWYGRSKLEMEKRVAAEMGGLNYLILRPPMVLGPRDQATLPLFKMARSPLRFTPGFSPKFYSFIAVSDLVGAIFAALDSEWSQLKQRCYFVASGQAFSGRDLIQTAADTVGRKGIILSIPQPVLKGLSRVIDAVPSWRTAIPNLARDRAKEIWPDRWVVSPAAFEEDFAWKATETLATSLQQTKDWYVKTGQLRA